MPTTGDKKQSRKVRGGASDGSRSSVMRGEPEPGESELRRFAHPITDVLVLAAADRAERHEPKDEPGVTLREVFGHMGFIYNSAATRQLRPRLDALLAAGLLTHTRRHGVKLWVLTSTGRQTLAKARRKGEAVELPESPQHRRWRHARTTAAERIDGYREQVRVALDEAGKLIDAGPNAHSDVWFDLAVRLKDECWQLGSATHCLQEWPEPDEAHPDIDDHNEPGEDELDSDERNHRSYLRISRRNVWMWKHVSAAIKT
jgi:hypothetical protein